MNYFVRCPAAPWLNQTVPLAIDPMISTLRFHLTQHSSNGKTGPIPVSTSSRPTCSPSCVFAGNGCYAEAGPLALHWQKVTSGARGVTAAEFCRLIAALLPNQLWRHNQAGDLPHTLGRISRRFLRQLVAANRGRRGYTYSHHDLRLGENLGLLRWANRQGFTVNASTETETAADSAIAAGLPAVLAVQSTEQRKAWRTPGGNVVTVCPAQRFNFVKCSTCELCHKRPPRLIVAFLAHGTSHKKANAALAGANT